MIELLRYVLAWMADKGRGAKAVIGFARCLFSLPGYLRRIVVSLRRIAIAMEKLSNGVDNDE